MFTALHQWFGIYVANEGDFRPGNVILNMLMIRTDINAVMWSMKVECVATPVILLSVWLVQRNGASWLWAIIAVLFALSFWGPYVHALGDASFYAFLVGVLAQHYGSRIAGIRPSIAAIAALLSVVVFCYLGTRKQTAPVLMLECVCAACLVSLIAWRPVALFRPLDLGVVRFYGKISYSFYLLHLLGILFANQALAAANFPIAALPASVAMITVLIASVLMTHAGGLFVLALYRGAVHLFGEEF